MSKLQKWMIAVMVVCAMAAWVLRAFAFDDPILGLFCQGDCSYVGSLTVNDPNDITTTSVAAFATGNLGGNSGNISGSMFTQCGGGCHYSLASDPGCLSPAYPFTFADICGCKNLQPTFHFCYQDPGNVCQETFSGGWNADTTNHGAYLFIHMQSGISVNKNVNGQCRPDRQAIFELDLDSVPYSDCDGKLGPNNLPIPPFYCNENYTPAPTAEYNGHPITGNWNLSGVGQPDD